jgi:hypothetical protein
MKLDNDLEASIHKALEGFEIPYVGPVGNGLYQIGPGTYTGKKGFSMFEEAMKKEAEKWAANNGAYFYPSKKLVK